MCVRLRHHHCLNRSVHSLALSFLSFPSCHCIIDYGWSSGTQAGSTTSATATSPETHAYTAESEVRKGSGGPPATNGSVDNPVTVVTSKASVAPEQEVV